MNTKDKKIIILTAGCLVLFAAAKGAAKSNAAAFAAFKPDERVKISVLSNALKNAGLNDPQLQFALSQILHETGRFSKISKVSLLNKNYSGIIYINKPYQKNATRGSLRRKSEGGNYAKFATIQDWANDFVRILKLKSKPAFALSLPEYVFRLARNGYFFPNTGKHYDIYFKGLKNNFDLLTV